jgi:hypothetical protein
MLSPASAYIDPGTGGYIISGIGPAIWAILIAAGGIIFGFFRRIIIDKAKQNKVATIIILVLLVAVVYLLLDNPEPTQVTKGGLLDDSAPDTSTEKEDVTGETDLEADPEVIFDESVSGAHIYDEAKVYDGYNLFEGKLIDMDGNLVKNWSSIYLGILDEEGNYYAQEYYESQKFGKYTWDGEVIWEKDIPIHHQILLTDEGNVITFTKEVVDYNGRDVEFDVILELDGETGELLSEFSLWDHKDTLDDFHRQLELDHPEDYEIPDAHRMNASIWGGHYDYYHLNYMQLLPENDLGKQYAALQKGNWLLSFRHGSMIFILDKDTKEVVWRSIYDQVEDNLEGQHSPQMLPSSKILIFDNGRYREWSRVIELDPLTLEVTWQFKAPWFYSLSQSHAQRLPNGNTLITEAEDGHVFEITRNGYIVWEYYHTDKQGPTNYVVEEKWGKRQEIYKMERYGKSFIDQFL